MNGVNVPRKEFIKIMEENIIILHHLAQRLKPCPDLSSQYSRQQLETIVRLHLGGRAKLKDIANRELTTVPNLCAMFRKLESDGLVMREVDENDRRNVFYAVTESGVALATDALEKFRMGIETLFHNINKSDEKELTSALKTINKILTKMEQ